MGPPIATAISRASSLCFTSPPLFLLPHSSLCLLLLSPPPLSLLLFLYLHALSSSNFVCVIHPCDYSNSIYHIPFDKTDKLYKTLLYIKFTWIENNFLMIHLTICCYSSEQYLSREYRWYPLWWLYMRFINAIFLVDSSSKRLKHCSTFINFFYRFSLLKSWRSR